jgi:hypothetical protein
MVELAHFVILKTIGDVEIRRYPKMIFATVKGVTDDIAFDVLFQYISGHNCVNQKIAMTVPVVTSTGGQEKSSEKIAMTAPVISTPNAMSFIMPAEYTMDTLPEPLDLRLRIEEVDDRNVAALRFKGRADEEDVEKHKEELLKTLDIQGILTVGEVFLMRYNAPFTPGFLRRNEVAIELRA